MRVVAQGMGIMDVLCDAIYNILKLKTLKLFSNMELIKKLYPVEYNSIIINDTGLYLIGKIIHII